MNFWKGLIDAKGSRRGPFSCIAQEASEHTRTSEKKIRIAGLVIKVAVKFALSDRSEGDRRCAIASNDALLICWSLQKQIMAEKKLLS